MAAMQRVPRNSLGRVSSLDFDAWRQIERDVAMRMKDVTANVGVRVEWFGLRAIKAEHQLFLLVHCEFISRPLNHVSQGCSGTERVGLSHAIEDDAEVHRVNSRVRVALKGKGLLGAADSAVQALERIDLTNAQKRDERFYPPETVIVFNQKVCDAQPGAKGKLAGIFEIERACRG